MKSERVQKAAVLAAASAALFDEFEKIRAASRATRAGGNDEESRAEDKYDTLSTEQNYLADGLAKQAQTAREAHEAFEKLSPRDFNADDPIDLGALVLLAFPGEKTWFLFAPAGGGHEFEHAGRTITIITPESPLGAQLRGLRVGESTKRPTTRIVEIV